MNSLYGNYRTRKFTDIFGDLDSFLSFADEFALDLSEIEDNIPTIYYLLYGFYGNSHITSSDENQWKYRLFSLIYMYAPVWQKKVEVQKNLRALTEDEISRGTSAIYNHAYNPSTAPATDTTDALTYIDNQNTTQYKRSKIDAYANLYAIIENDVTKEFINRFKGLFIAVVAPQLPLWYVTDTEQDDDEEVEI